MRLDHIAYRVADRKKSAQFFIDAFGYKIQTEFDINFSDGSTAKCIALEPPEKTEDSSWSVLSPPPLPAGTSWLPSLDGSFYIPTTYHMAPEIFVSDGTPDSIVGKWVAARAGVGGIHHLAYQVDSVENTVKEWREKGYAEFSSEKPLTCPGLVQIFSKPSSLTGVVFEFIERGKHGFCKENVKELMQSTKENM